MISVVICSRTRHIADELQQNIDQTIGCEYQLVVIDNSAHAYNIFEAYNEGVKRSSCDIVCFMHDDILHHAFGWGRNVVEWFRNPQIGMLGISGNTYMSRIPAIWWASGYWGNRTAVRQNSIDTDKNDRQNSTRTCINPLNERYSEVLMNDGLFFCIRKKLFDEGLCFDDKTFGGFHFYDLDISFQVRAMGYKVVCVYDVVVEHISHSVLNREWLSAARIFYGKWGHSLPAATVRYDKKSVAELEYDTFRTIKHILKENGVSFWSYFNREEYLYMFKKCFVRCLREKIK